MKNCTVISVTCAVLTLASSARPLAGAAAVGNVDQTSPPAWRAFVDADKTISAYTETVEAYEVTGTKTQHRTYHMYFRKPDLVRAEIVRGQNAGSVAVWHGGATVRAHRGGLLSFITLTLPRNDARVVDCRGDTVESTFFPEIIHSFEEAGSITQAPGPTIDGTETDAASVSPSDPSKYGNATKMTLYLSRKTHLPVARRAWNGDMLIEDAHFADQDFNVDIPDSQFSL